MVSGQRESTMAPPPAPSEAPELLEDGQEEVFSWTAVEHGIVKDPPAIGPVEECEPKA